MSEFHRGRSNLPICALQAAMEGYEVVTMEEVARVAQGEKASRQRLFAVEE